ncbi:MAG: hypothetical protein PHI85_05360 [Victivallaceae bacterium]|nr:hypothetical protein [Victivallaceae bacterium]
MRKDDYNRAAGNAAFQAGGFIRAVIPQFPPLPAGRLSVAGAFIRG